MESRRASWRPLISSFSLRMIGEVGWEAWMALSLAFSFLFLLRRVARWRAGLDFFAWEDRSLAGEWMRQSCKVVSRTSSA